jgi:hypothetical protein
MWTDAQFAALLSTVTTGLGGIALMIRWAVTRITKAMDDQSSTNLRLADAQIDLAGALAAQRADIDHITRWIYHHTPGASPIEVERERTPVQSVPAMTPTRMRAFSSDDEIDQRPGSSRRSQAGPLRRTTAVRGVPIHQDDDTPQLRGPFRDRHNDDER